MVGRTGRVRGDGLQGKPGNDTIDKTESSCEKLTEDETAALLSYKSSESYKINAKLRDGISLTEREEKMVADLDSALEKLPKVKGTVYRTLNFDDVFDPEGEFEDFMALHTEGGFAHYSAYTSTSTNRDGYPLADGVRYGVTIEISGSSARDLAGFGNNFESEALFPRGTEFDIVKVTINQNGHPHIYMKEMQDNAQQEVRRNEPNHDTEKRSVAMRDLQETHSSYADLQGVPEGNPGENQIRAGNLREPREELEFSSSGANQWSTTRVGDQNVKPKTLSEIFEDVRQKFGINITTGHVRGAGVKGTYNRRTEGVRTKIANDLPTLSHEIGHHLDNMYGLTDNLRGPALSELVNNLGDDMRAAYAKKKWKTEGLAEFVRKFLQNREVAAIDYPEFTKYFMETLTGSDAALVYQLADEINAYFAFGAQSAAGNIRFREEKGPDGRTLAEKIREKGDAIYQAWVDANHGIKRFDEAAGSEVYKLAANSAYSDAVAANIIVHDLRNQDGQYVGPGLSTVLSGINLKDKAEYRAFGEYLVVKHGPERLREGMRVFADDRQNSTNWMKARQAELEEQYFNSVYNNTGSDKDENGNSIPGSKQDKIIDFMEGMNLTDEEWN